MAAKNYTPFEDFCDAAREGNAVAVATALRAGEFDVFSHGAKQTATWAVLCGRLEGLVKEIFTQRPTLFLQPREFVKGTWDAKAETLGMKELADWLRVKEDEFYSNRRALCLPVVWSEDYCH